MADQETINTTDDLMRIFDSLVNNINSSERMHIKVGDEWPKTIRFRFEGTVFDSTLTTSIMRGLLKIQDAVYHIYAIRKYGEGASKRDLSKEERETLEIVVKVDKGSSIVDVLVENVYRIFTNMSGEQALIGIGIIAFSWLAGTIGKTWIEQHYKNKKDEIDRKIQESRSEEQKSLYSTLKETVEIAVTAQKGMFRAVAEAPITRVQIQDESFDKESIAEIAKIERKRIESVRRVLDGDFYITDLHFGENETSFDAEVSDSKTILRRIAIQDAIISQDDFSIIQNAVKRDAIALRIVVEEKDGKVQKAFLDSVQGNN